MDLISRTSLSPFFPDGSMPCPLCDPDGLLAHASVPVAVPSRVPRLDDGCQVCRGAGRVVRLPWGERSEDQVAERLWVSGWNAPGGPYPHLAEVDVVLDMAGPGPDPGPEVIWRVREVVDAPLGGPVWEEFEDAAAEGHRAWSEGGRVMVRCEAGLNRSGLTAALLLVEAGLGPREALSRLRALRSPFMLCNPDYLAALLARR